MAVIRSTRWSPPSRAGARNHAAWPLPWPGGPQCSLMAGHRHPGPSRTCSSPCMMPAPGTPRCRPAPGAESRSGDSSAAVRTGTARPARGVTSRAPHAGRTGPSPPGTGQAGRGARSARTTTGVTRSPSSMAIVTALDPGAGRETVADAVRRAAPRPSYQQKLAWALEKNPALLTGDGHLRAAARDPAVHRDAPRRGRRRGRPPGMRALRPRGAHRQADGRRPGLPDLHRALPHRAVRTLRSHPRARHPRRAGPAGLRELLHHRPGEPGDLHRLRPASARSSGEPRTGRFAPGALPFRSWPARSAGRRCPAGSPGQPGCHGARPASAGGPRAQPADAMRRSPPAR